MQTTAGFNHCFDGHVRISAQQLTYHGATDAKTLGEYRMSDAFSIKNALQLKCKLKLCRLNMVLVAIQYLIELLTPIHYSP